MRSITHSINFPEISADVARRLLGDENRHESNRRTLAWGKRGSLKMDVAAGTFYDHEAQEGGGVLDLIRHVDGGDPWQWLRDNGFVADRGHEYSPRIAPKRAKPARQGSDPDTLAKRALAASIWAEAGDLRGTPGETYLRGRAITSWPDAAMRWHSAAPSYPGDPDPRPALVLPFVDDAGEVVAVQLIRVTASGQKITDARAKTSLGPIATGRCILPGDGVLHLAEGPETALSIWMATGSPVQVCGSTISARHIERLIDRRVILATDAAEENSAVNKALSRAIYTAQNRGLSYAVAVPDGPAKTDFNDILVGCGVEAVRAQLAAIAWEGPNRPATCRAPRGDVEDARKIVDGAFGRWQADAMSWQADAPTPVLAVRVSTGVGKSYRARHTALDMVRHLRRQGDHRPVVIAVPRHNLGDEYAAEMVNHHDIIVRVYRGRNAADPDADGERMCRRADEAAEVSKAGGKVSDTLCKRGDVECPFFNVCGHMRQRNAVADIWIVPHNLLWRKSPPCIGEPAALIVDEDPTGTGLAGFDGTPLRLSLDDIAMSPRLPDAGAMADLSAITGRIASRLRDIEDGPVPHDIGVSDDDIRAAIKLVWQGHVDPVITPNMSADQVKQAAACVAGQNRKIRRLDRLLRIVRDANGETLPGVVRETVKAAEGDGYAAIRLRWRETVGERWNVPTIIASATCQAVILRAFWPDLDDVIEADATMPHVKVRQVTDRAFGMSSLAPTPSKHDADRLRARVRRYIETRAAQLGGRVLVVAQKRIVEALREDGLPDNVETVHFNGLSGLDCWRDVRGLIVIGRTMPSPTDAEDRAEVLSGLPVEHLVGWYPLAAAAVDLGGGEGPAIMRGSPKGQAARQGTERHPDPLAEAVRWSICEGELMQAIGRGRGVNRTAETPLDVDILAAYPLPIAVNEAAPFDALEPSPLDLMAARGVVVTDTHQKGAWPMVASILPDLFPSPDAARVSFSREHNPIDSLIGICSGEHWRARIKLASARYGVDVVIRAATEGEARQVINRILPDAVILHLNPPQKRLIRLKNPPPVTLPCGNRPRRLRDPVRLIRAKSLWFLDVAAEPLRGFITDETRRFMRARGDLPEMVPG